MNSEISEVLERIGELHAAAELNHGRLEERLASAETRMDREFAKVHLRFDRVDDRLEALERGRNRRR